MESQCRRHRAIMVGADAIEHRYVSNKYGDAGGNSYNIKGIGQRPKLKR